MEGRRILWAQGAAAFILAALTWIALWQSLYWRLWWFDIPMHVLGGVWASLCGAWLLAWRGERFSLAWCLTFTFFVGISWEIFEYSEGITFPKYMDYSVDTGKDIVMDLLGAVLGFFFARSLWDEGSGRKVL